MTLRYTTLHHTRLHYTTIHYATLHYTTPHHTTLQLQLHYTTTYNCATPHYIQQLRVRRPPQPLEPLQWIRFAIHASQQLTSPIGFLSLKLLPLPCSVLLMILMQIAGDKNGVCIFVREFLMVWILSTPPQVVPKWLTGYGAVA
jgi:hypothetical protein